MSDLKLVIIDIGTAIELFDTAVVMKEAVSVPLISCDSADLTGYFVGRTQNPYIWAAW